MDITLEHINNAVSSIRSKFNCNSKLYCNNISYIELLAIFNAVSVKKIKISIFDIHKILTYPSFEILAKSNKDLYDYWNSYLKIEHIART